MNRGVQRKVKWIWKLQKGEKAHKRMSERKDDSRGQSGKYIWRESWSEEGIGAQATQKVEGVDESEVKWEARGPRPRAVSPWVADGLFDKETDATHNPSHMQNNCYTVRGHKRQTNTLFLNPHVSLLRHLLNIWQHIMGKKSKDEGGTKAQLSALLPSSYLVRLNGVMSILL